MRDTQPPSKANQAFQQAHLDLSARTVGSVVEVTRQFLRSVKIDTDLGRTDALDGYVCQGTARSVLENMAQQLRETQQRAFTWTGPYGGGKSSLALALASLVGADRKVRLKAQKVLGITPDSLVAKVFAATGDGWLVVPVVGNRGSVTEAISDAISKAQTGRRKPGRRPKPIDALKSEARDRPKQGVLLIIDELGKFLEGAAQSGDDIYFYQQLAEEASRCEDGKIVVVGILHQAFEAYASRMGREVQDEWSKVQGRYVDIPLVAASDEVIELTAGAISQTGSISLEPIRGLAARVAQSIRRRRPSAPQNLADALTRCWPLHPATVSLLGPMSRRRYGQNERSTFGFLSSREPLGFAEFLETTPLSGLPTYTPAALWDYLRANLEPAILASTDSHRWSTGVDAVARAEAKGSPLHAALTKTIAVIEMFRSASGLAADGDTLATCFPEESPDILAQALLELSQWSIALHRKHLDAWGIFAGSDFDIDAAVAAARSEIGEPDLAKIAALTDLVPLVAKRLYHETGTMRWFTRTLLRSDQVTQFLAKPDVPANAAGTLALVLPKRDQRPDAVVQAVRQASRAAEAHLPLLLGVAHESESIVETASELAALERVFVSRLELEGDLIARREVESRLTATRVSLVDTLQQSFEKTDWFDRGDPLDLASVPSLSALVSSLAQRRFPQSPWFFSELLNRDAPSSNAVKARRDLMYRMLASGEQPNLGYDGYPADAGLYYTLLKPAGLHRALEDGRWGFSGPDHSERGEKLKALWDATLAHVAQPEKMTGVDSLYLLWALPPYGVKAGVMPTLALAFFLAHRNTLALYIDGNFSPELSEVQVDEWLHDPRRVAFRYVEMQDDRKEVLGALATKLSVSTGRPVIPAALDVARALVALMLQLPKWAQKTGRVSKRAQEVRAMLLRASDPHRVMFIELPMMIGSNDGDSLVRSVGEVVDELSSAYQHMLYNVDALLRNALDDEGLGKLSSRAENIVGLSGNFTFESFVTRLRAYTGSQQDIEGLITLACSRPPAAWVDRDIESATLKLSEWAREFRRVETFASLKGRKTNRRALTILFGDKADEVVTAEYDIATDEQPKVDALSRRLLAELAETKSAVLFAALAEVSRELMRTAKKGD